MLQKQSPRGTNSDRKKMTLSKLSSPSSSTFIDYNIMSIGTWVRITGTEYGYGCSKGGVAFCVYPFQSQKSRSWRSFSRLEVSASSRNQSIAPNSKINWCNLITSAPPTILYSRSRIVSMSILGSNHLTNARKPP